MSVAKPDANAVRVLLAGSTLTFGIPAYNEGDGVIPTFVSLWEGLVQLGVTEAQIILSDSSDIAGRSSAEYATEWADSVGARLMVDSVDRRRSLKEALNATFECARSDLLVLLNGDVKIPAASLRAMLYGLLASPRPVVAIGATLPDPAFSTFDRRAGAWQLRAATRSARLSPRSIAPDSFRAEGAFWGVWRNFYSTYRYPIGDGSIADDVELTEALIKGGYACRSVPDAFVYKVPPNSVVDLCLGLVRGQVALAEHNRRGNDYLAAVIEAARDPLGAFLYGLARIWCRRNRRRLREESVSEWWRMLGSTKRTRSDG